MRAKELWFSGLAAVVGLCLAPTVDAQPDETADRPNPAELEARGARIGALNIRIDNVFDTSNPEEDKPLYRWANRVHAKTRQSVIEDILLFEEGDSFETRLIEESARLLRARGSIADASIDAASYDPATNSATIDVWLRDSWSLEPDLKLSRSGGQNEYGAGLTEDNLFGFGKSLTVAWSSDVDRDQRIFSFTDPNVGGSRKRLGVSVADNSDGRRFSFDMGRPFFSLDTRWSISGRVLDDERIDPIYDLGEIIDEFRHDTEFASIEGGISRGFVDGATRRWLAGLTYEEDLFQPAANRALPLLLPENRKLVYPWVGLNWVEDDYRQVTELNDMGRTEDVALGLNLLGTIGLASPHFGSDRRAVLFNFSAQRGWEPGGPGRLFILGSSAAARQEQDGTKNSIVSLSGRYYRRNLGNELFITTLNAVFSNRLDAENQVLLGGDNNLRGYPIRYQSGENSVVLNVEQRFFTDWYPFRLIRVGYAFFFDAGRVWGNDPRQTPNLGTLYDIGIGLRLTSPRSSGRSIVHVDLAFPIDAPADIDNVQLIVEKKGSF